MNGFYRVAAASPELKVADVTFNLNEMMRLYRDAAYQGAALVRFPELSLTGASCGDLFFQERLLKRAKEAALEFAAATAGMNCAAVFGMPVRVQDALYNVAVVACEGKICGDAVMCYPPGIPILAPGELITTQIVDHIVYASQKGCSVTGLDDRQRISIVSE